MTTDTPHHETPAPDVTPPATPPVVPDGLVIYTDGSDRHSGSGWGLHAYTYQNTPLERAIRGLKTPPTAEGYKEAPLEQTVTVLEYFEAFGGYPKRMTNNVAELTAMLEGFRLAFKLGIPQVRLISDSKYVINGINRNLATWQEAGWRKANGEPVANVEIWQEMLQAKTALEAAGIKYSLHWVGRDSGDMGNELADSNARLGSGNFDTSHFATHAPEDYHTQTLEINPLNLRTRLLFNTEIKQEQNPQRLYHIYRLGRLQNYGYKPDDKLRERHDKTDLLLGRRISDACFTVLQLPEHDAFLEQLKDHHSQLHHPDSNGLAVVRLDTVYRSNVSRRLLQLGMAGLVGVAKNLSVTTPTDDLVSKTLNPPRRAMEAVAIFGMLESTLLDFLAGKELPHLGQFDITDMLYETVQEGNKKPKVSLRSEITMAEPRIPVSFQFRGVDVTQPLIQGIDILPRNPLARLATQDPKVTLLVQAEGPSVYSLATIIQSNLGNVIVRSPYTQFVLNPSTPT